MIGHGNSSIVSVFLRKGAKLGSATWAMASGKPDIQLILLNKLMEDGNTLYRSDHKGERARHHVNISGKTSFLMRPIAINTPSRDLAPSRALIGQCLECRLLIGRWRWRQTFC